MSLKEKLINAMLFPITGAVVIGFKKDIKKLLKDFEIKEFSYKEEYYPDYTGAHYFVLVKK